ncbi:MAG: hypothetical protein ACR2NZ_04835 [Rubripirellula sp.]
MRRVLLLVLFILLVSPPVIRTGGFAQDSGGVEFQEQVRTEVDLETSDEDASFVVDQIETNLEGSFGADEITATSGWIQSAGITEWLGPLAPVALSPFFGVTCLSGLSLWGPSWATDNPMLGSTGALRSEVIFTIFLLLTILTSVPRFTKVSKPFAQAVDRVEAYAVIVILLVIKVAASMESAGDEQVAMVQFGVIGFTVDTLLAIAMIVNVLVINSVKFFFEFMVWLTPVPFLDAVFEVCNKTLCAVLMAIYAFSPTLATLINLVFFLVAAILFRWISRRVRFYRTMMLDPILAKVWPGYGKPRHAELVVFNRDEFGPFPAKSRLRLRRSENPDEGWHLREANWWMPAHDYTLSPEASLEVRLGWLMNGIEFQEGTDDGSTNVLTFSRRYNVDVLRSLLDDLGIPLSEAPAGSPQTDLKLEFS